MEDSSTFSFLRQKENNNNIQLPYPNTQFTNGRTNGQCVLVQLTHTQSLSLDGCNHLRTNITKDTKDSHRWLKGGGTDKKNKILPKNCQFGQSLRQCLVCAPPHLISQEDEKENLSYLIIINKREQALHIHSKERINRDVAGNNKNIKKKRTTLLRLYSRSLLGFRPSK